MQQSPMQRAKEAVEASERRFRSLIEHASDLVIVIDANGIIKYASPSLTKMGGYQVDEVLGRSMLEFTHPDDVAAARRTLSDVIADPHSAIASQLRYRRKDGVDLVLDSIAKNALADPAIGGIVINARDVTERNRQRREIEFKNLILSTQSEMSPDGILVVDENGKILSSNRKFGDMWGIQESMLAAGDDEPVLRSALAKVAEPEQFLQRVKYLYERRDEKSSEEIALKDGRIIDRYSAPMAGPDGKYYGRVWYFRDITGRKRAEQELKRLGWAMRALSQSNSALAHAATDEELFRSSCAAIASTAAYPLAWIGRVEDDGARNYTPVAIAGEAAAALEGSTFSWAEGPLADGPTGRAIRTGVSQVVDDFALDGGVAPWREKLQAYGLASAIALPIRGEGKVIGALSVYGRVPHAFGKAEIALFEELVGDIAYGIAVRRTRAAYEAGLIERERSAVRLRASLESSIQAIAATVEMRDPYTAGHERRVAELAAAIAREMGLPAFTVEGIHFGSMIHDLGKIQVPAEILSKPTRLLPIEFELIKGHAKAGYDILKGIEFPWPIAAMVLQHHERIDGSGYPNGLKGEQILLEARVLAVADTVEAMSSHRPYRPGLGIDAALAEVEKNSGRLYDAAVVQATLRLFRERGYQIPA